ncbi:MAG: 4Fe-4S ferredoxin [Clostridia bacterium]|nr:4Fe-4S ferredoxin [Clostridia bacterium]MBN2884036.1 4Fe-4S ferredoxin [Clostridia bacterium]
MKRIDERDTMFARMSYKNGSDRYVDYYSRNPGKQEIDDELRSRTELFSDQTPYFDKYLSTAAEANFDFINDIRHLAEESKPHKKISIDSEEVSALLKKLAVHYGALDAGIAFADDKFFYTHRGRLEESYGDKVDTSLKNALVFTIEMNEETINTSPAADAAAETSNAYVKGAVIGLQLTYFIKNLGFRSRCHMDGNYLLYAPPLAVEAGLGEMGRNGLLISKAKGCFCRIGIVTTDIPLIPDEKSDLDIDRFCKLCRQCIRTCPGKTVSSSDDPKDWHVEQEKCYGVWRNLGTDCGICICACPIGQDIPADRIKGMSDRQIAEYMEEYKEKNGTRKRNLKFFL